MPMPSSRLTQRQTYQQNLIGYKWVFRVKYNSDGSILKHKARLVTKGFIQTLGIDYVKTFSPVIKAPTIRFPWLLLLVEIFNKLMLTMLFLMVI